MLSSRTSPSRVLRECKELGEATEPPPPPPPRNSPLPSTFPAGPAHSQALAPSLPRSLFFNSRPFCRQLSGYLEKCGLRPPARVCFSRGCPARLASPRLASSSSAGAWIGQPVLTPQRAGGSWRTSFNRWLGLVRVSTFEWGLGERSAASAGLAGGVCCCRRCSQVGPRTPPPSQRCLSVWGERAGAKGPQGCRLFPSCEEAAVCSGKGGSSRMPSPPRFPAPPSLPPISALNGMLLQHTCQSQLLWPYQCCYCIADR